MVALPYVEKVICLINTQINFVERQILSQTDFGSLPESYHEKTQWEGGQMELVELVYALHEAGSFSNVPLKKLFTFISEMFNCKISNYYRLFWDIKNRIGKERTFFLNKLREVLSAKLLRMDDGARS